MIGFSAPIIYVGSKITVYSQFNMVFLSKNMIFILFPSKVITAYYSSLVTVDDNYKLRNIFNLSLLFSLNSTNPQTLVGFFPSLLPSSVTR